MQILRTFFALIFGTILFSLLAGLVWLPVALSLIGPTYISSAAGPAAMDLPVAAGGGKLSGSVGSGSNGSGKPGPGAGDDNAGAFIAARGGGGGDAKQNSSGGTNAVASV